MRSENGGECQAHAQGGLAGKQRAPGPGSPGSGCLHAVNTAMPSPTRAHGAVNFSIGGAMNQAGLARKVREGLETPQGNR